MGKILSFLFFVFSECRICFEEVDNLEYFYSHVKIHSGKTQFECKYCFLGKFIGSCHIAAFCCKIYFYCRYHYAVRCLFELFFQISDPKPIFLRGYRKSLRRSSIILCICAQIFFYYFNILSICSDKCKKYTFYVRS